MLSVHLYKDVGGRELIMRRVIHENGATGWVPQPLVEGVIKGDLVHLDGVDLLGSTAGILSRLSIDRELELWDEKRMVKTLSKSEEVRSLSYLVFIAAILIIPRKPAFFKPRTSQLASSRLPQRVLR